MKKCPQCGNDILLDCNRCDYCGYSSEIINKTYSYGQMSKNKIEKNILIIFVFIFIVSLLLLFVFSFL